MSAEASSSAAKPVVPAASRSPSYIPGWGVRITIALCLIGVAIVRSLPGIEGMPSPWNDLALANILTSLEYGITDYDSSVGGLGGCMTPGSTGNVATEEVVHMLEDMGIDTGIDLKALIEVAKMAEGLVQRRLESGVLRAGPRTQLWQRPKKAVPETV